MKLDHLAVVCRNLDRGCAWVEGRMGVSLLPGGEHPRYGTHNRLLRLGPGEYFEVIAPNPAVAKPDGARWFNLDAAPEEPRLANWIVQTGSIATSPFDAGPAIALSRGELNWSISVPEDGSLPQGGGLPTLIEWPTGIHPATRMPDSGVRLTGLKITHPQAEKLAALVLPHLPDSRITYAQGSEIRLQAVFTTPSGSCSL